MRTGMFSREPWMVRRMLIDYCVQEIRGDVYHHLPIKFFSSFPWQGSDHLTAWGCLNNLNNLLGWRDRTTGRMLALHRTDLGSIPCIPSNPQASPGMISEHRIRSKSRACPRFSTKHTKKWENSNVHTNTSVHCIWIPLWMRLLKWNVLLSGSILCAIS